MHIKDKTAWVLYSLFYYLIYAYSTSDDDGAAPSYSKALLASSYWISSGLILEVASAGTRCENLKLAFSRID
jgi:hypothetical protein